ncbi:hypothetical protein K491DRAFT_681268 [Lophiostoma macrostomum CBS 122681]|uniref:Uncharacterized protein n=1 Tax=Lophiostoma macrostomum CBS 122681 TaxID=1314788 RepID=A0A6A6T133_9PLEO|nr:hypothetical protein K491DRAFT_681268 [Lophiostoma macrostomum CBS 122681]
MGTPAIGTNRHVVRLILHHLSAIKYKDRRQRGPDEPVELLEFRPTLVPSILVNRLWADEGSSVLWRRYPHLPALRDMDPERRQYYASKVQQLFTMGPPSRQPESLDFLDGLQWPRLKSLELEIDFIRHGHKFLSMLSPGLEHIELSGLQSCSSAYFAEVVLPSLLTPCQSIKSLRFGAALFSEDEAVHVSVLYDHLDSLSAIETFGVKGSGFVGNDDLFLRLSQYHGLLELEIDLDPGVLMLAHLDTNNPLRSPLSLPFPSLKRLSIMCYPEVTLALPTHLGSLEDLEVDICRVPDRFVEPTDFHVVDDLLSRLSHCGRLHVLKVGIGPIALDFPSSSSLPFLSGQALSGLARSCERLRDIHIFAAEPSAIDGSDLRSEDFEAFCKSLPALVRLNLKIHPGTATSLEQTALQSLGDHCAELEVLRLKIPIQLPSLSVPSNVPQVLVSTPTTPAMEHDSLRDLATNAHYSFDGFDPDPSHSAPFPALFPRLTHLAISRPENPLVSLEAEDIAPELEEALVRSWAHPLLIHFPRLEILEAWGDWMGQDNECLKYFLPMEEVLASTWEFLSGAEQDLWDGDEEEDVNWNGYESVDDWDAASYLNEYPAGEHAHRTLPPLAPTEQLSTMSLHGESSNAA